jgi:hypothetical protein
MCDIMEENYFRHTMLNYSTVKEGDKKWEIVWKAGKTIL